MLRVSWIHFLLICSDIAFSCLRKRPKTVALILNQFFKGWIVCFAGPGQTTEMLLVLDFYGNKTGITLEAL